MVKDTHKLGKTPLDEGSARGSPVPDSQETDTHGAGGIRTRNPSKRTAADPRLRPLGQWDRRISYLTGIIYVPEEISVITLS